MSSPIPGDEDSEDSEVVPAGPCFEVDENAEVVVVLRSEVSVVLDLRGGGGICEFFNETLRVFIPTRCLFNMKRGMASARLVPMNCGRFLVLGT